MTNLLRLTALAVAAACVLTTPAFAGGGGSKTDTLSLKVRNDTGDPVYAYVVKKGEENKFQKSVIDRLKSGKSSTFESAWQSKGGVVLFGAVDPITGALTIDSQSFDVDDDTKQSVLFANAFDVDSVDLTDSDAESQIRDLFTVGPVQIHDEDVTVNLEDF